MPFHDRKEEECNAINRIDTIQCHLLTQYGTNNGYWCALIHVQGWGLQQDWYLTRRLFDVNCSETDSVINVLKMRLLYNMFVCRIHRSEYYNNFKAPSDFVYQEGAWRGADPPHLNQGQVSTLVSMLD